MEKHKMVEIITKYDQRASIRFCFLLGKTASETLTMVQEAYKDGALGRTQVFEWYGRFKRGEMSIEDQPRSGRPVEAVVLADSRRTIGEVSTLTGVPWRSCQEILSQNLGLRWVAAKMVPCVLTPEQKAARMDMCQESLQHIEEDPGLLGKVITADETWRHSRSAVKAMLICFFDAKGVVHSEFVLPGQSVNQDHYIQVLRRLREAVRQKHPELWQDGEWWLHHDNAPAHRALRVMQSLEVKQKSKDALNGINTHKFTNAFESWKTQMQRCIQTSGDYFEGNSFE
uniref:Mos1 transposase HTH domain-containing protein n=1 Tax=Salarias fasciatus TaxID=181472 RepID=A0A672J5K0_SALFA